MDREQPGPGPRPETEPPPTHTQKTWEDTILRTQTQAKDPLQKTWEDTIVRNLTQARDRDPPYRRPRKTRF